VEATERVPAEPVFRISVFGNAALAVVKIALGWAAGSRALVADGAHSVVNLTLAGTAWLVRHFQVQPEARPYGRGKLEAFVGLLLGSVFLPTGLVLATYAWTSNARPVEGLASSLVPSIAVLSIVANGIGAWLARGAERREQSQVLALLAKGQISDAIAGAVALFAWIGTRSGFELADALGAFATGGLVAFLGWRFLWGGFNALLDRADPELSSAVADTVRRLERVKGVGAVDAYPLGRRFEIDLEVTVDPRLTVEEAARIAAAVETAVVSAHPSVSDVVVRTVPAPVGSDRAG
jgi:cation diffusion facilitator family transporter